MADDEASNAFPSGAGTRTLEVHYKSWNIKMSVIDPSTNQQLYALSGCGLGNRLETTNSHGQVIGVGRTSHNSSSVTIDMLNTVSDNVPGTFETHTGKKFGRGSPSFNSPAWGGMRMTWKNKAWSSKIVYTLIDDKGLALARFESAGMAFKRVGKLEIVEGVAGEEAKVNEIVVTVLTLVYRKLVAMNMAAVVS